RPRAHRAARRPPLRRQLHVDAHRRPAPARPRPRAPRQPTTTRRTPAHTSRAVEQYHITPIDHGFNSSTFPARVIVSTGADIGASVTGAIGALSGPLHGGAPSRALDLLDAIGTPDNARPYLIDAVTRGEKIMGFGHAVYRTEDPRSRMLHNVAKRLGAAKLGFAQQVEPAVVDV